MIDENELQYLMCIQRHCAMVQMGFAHQLKTVENINTKIRVIEEAIGTVKLSPLRHRKGLVFRTVRETDPEHGSFLNYYYSTAFHSPMLRIALLAFLTSSSVFVS